MWTQNKSESLHVMHTKDSVKISLVGFGYTGSKCFHSLPFRVRFLHKSSLVRSTLC